MIAIFSFLPNSDDDFIIIFDYRWNISKFQQQVNNLQRLKVVVAIQGRLFLMIFSV
jgi:hypothetical protein